MKNYSDTIKDPKQKTMTAKAYSFKYKVIELLVVKYGFTSRMEKGFKPIYEKFSVLFDDLIFNKQMSLLEIKQFIRESINLKIN